MRRVMVFGLAAGMALTALGQGATLYAPVRSIKDQGISVRGWGSGTISETDELAYEGAYSIRVSTKNFFQGGILDFANPVDLSQAYSDKNNLLRLLIRVADENLTLGGGGGGGRPGPGGDVGAPGGLVGGPGGVTGGTPSQGGGTPNTALKNVRLILTTSDGKKSEVYVPVSTSGSGDRGWRSVAVPLQAVAGLGQSNKMVKEIAVSGDAVSTFYLGDLRTINDSTPITGDINYRNMNLALGDEVTLVGRGFGGSSILTYTWDFNDKDGIQVDAEGQAVKRRFRKPGDYTITLTISDHFGLKPPYRTTAKVRVNP
jgi:hypothetical protein